MTVHWLPLVLAAAASLAALPAAAERSATKRGARGRGAAQAERALLPSVFSLRPNLESCAARTCDGFFVREMNRELTRCADGSEATECPVAHLEPTGASSPDGQTLQDLALAPPERRVLLAGRLTPASGKGASGAVLHVTRAWRPAGDGASEGSLFAVRDAGIRCVKAPCPSIRAVLVGEGTELLVTEVDLSRAKASPAEIDEAADDLLADGILVSGAPGPGPTPDVDVLIASRLYLRVVVPTACAGDDAHCRSR